MGILSLLANNLTQIIFGRSEFKYGDLLSSYLVHLYLSGIVN